MFTTQEMNAGQLFKKYLNNIVKNVVKYCYAKARLQPTPRQLTTFVWCISEVLEPGFEKLLFDKDLQDVISVLTGYKPQEIVQTYQSIKPYLKSTTLTPTTTTGAEVTE